MIEGARGERPRREVPPQEGAHSTLFISDIEEQIAELPAVGEYTDEETIVSEKTTPELIGDAAVRERSRHEELSDEAWVKRVLGGFEDGEEILEGYPFNQELEEELADIPSFGVIEKRHLDMPPPPALQEGKVVIPKHVYVAGLRWKLGEQLGQGQFGSVFDVQHFGEEQRARVVKIMAIQDTDEYASEMRFRLWNEVGAALASGDYVGHEVHKDLNGDTWMALILERHSGETMSRTMERKEEFTSEVWAYKQAMALRSILSQLRRMHAQGWMHGDIKPSNLMVNLEDGEESLSRPIDYGVSDRSGAIRRKRSSLVTGTPNYLLPERLKSLDADLRLQDYWSCLLSTAMSTGLITPPKKRIRSSVAQRKIREGTYFEAPELNDPDAADAYFEEQGASEAERAFAEWLYRFIQPHMDMHDRQRLWRTKEITVAFEIPDLKEGELGPWIEEKDRQMNPIIGQFLNDDRLINELEALIGDLAKEAGVDDPTEVLQQLQEFPSNQSVEERIGWSQSPTAEA